MIHSEAAEMAAVLLKEFDKKINKKPATTNQRALLKEFLNFRFPSILMYNTKK